MSIEIYLPKPHEGQIAAWTAAIEERFHAVCCGRRWGKTVMLVNIATSFATRKFAVPTTGQPRVGWGFLPHNTASTRKSGMKLAPFCNR
ncbi:hypothetical protein HEL23_023295 [Escherichia coli]|nr:hypothetical protein [Escherichia coli]MBB8072109.1 hypothetical protein [Escherichia coli]